MNAAIKVHIVIEKSYRVEYRASSVWSRRMFRSILVQTWVVGCVLIVPWIERIFTILASGRSNGGAVLDGLDKGRAVLQVRRRRSDRGGSRYRYHISHEKVKIE